MEPKMLTRRDLAIHYVTEQQMCVWATRRMFFFSFVSEEPAAGSHLCSMCPHEPVTPPPISLPEQNPEHGNK